MDDTIIAFSATTKVVVAFLMVRRSSDFKGNALGISGRKLVDEGKCC